MNLPLEQHLKCYHMYIFVLHLHFLCMNLLALCSELSTYWLFSLLNMHVLLVLALSRSLANEIVMFQVDAIYVPYVDHPAEVSGCCF